MDELSLENWRLLMDVNVWSVIYGCRTFIPLLKKSGGGHILNVHSVLSWLGVAGSYSASKAALWSQTNSLRLDLRPRGSEVTGLHVGYVDNAPPTQRTVDSFRLNQVLTSRSRHGQDLPSLKYERRSTVDSHRTPHAIAIYNHRNRWTSAKHEHTTRRDHRE